MRFHLLVCRPVAPELVGEHIDGMPDRRVFQRGLRAAPYLFPIGAAVVTGLVERGGRLIDRRMVALRIGLHAERKAHRQPELTLRRRAGRRRNAMSDHLFVEHPLKFEAALSRDRAGQHEGLPVAVLGDVASHKKNSCETEAEHIEHDGVRRLVDEEEAQIFGTLVAVSIFARCEESRVIVAFEHVHLLPPRARTSAMMTLVSSSASTAPAASDERRRSWRLASFDIETLAFRV